MSDQKQAAIKASEPTVNLTQAELQKLLADAAETAAVSAAAQVRTELLAGVAKGAGAARNGEGGLMERLALAIAEISDQGTSRKRVAPEILVARANAHTAAVELLMSYRAKGVKPEYALVASVYLNERLIPPFTQGPDRKPVRTQIIYTGMPNDAMRPVNAAAKELYALWRRSVGSLDTVKGTVNDQWMTGNGLVVKAPPAAGQRAYTPLPVLADADFVEDLDIKTQDDPTAPFVQVLGTVAPPAKQNAAGHQFAAS